MLTMYCRTYDIGVKGIVPEGREMIMPGEDATMTLYISKRMVCLNRKIFILLFIK
jgi:translation elongation factor EF-Tu-like GTPase